MVTLLFISIGLGVVTRAAPSLNIFSVGLPATIVVRLVERRPFAVWQSEGKFLLVDRPENPIYIKQTDVRAVQLAKAALAFAGLGNGFGAVAIFKLQLLPAQKPVLVKPPFVYRLPMRKCVKICSLP